MILESVRGVDAVFVALHGGAGEDGRVQAVLELAGLSYVGSRPGPSAVAMDKVWTKAIAREIGVPATPEHVVAADASVDAVRNAAAALGDRLVLKPTAEGSAVGVHLCDGADAVADAWETEERGDGPWMIEPYVPGREMTVPLLWDEAYAVIEIRPREGFYDYTNKYSREDGATAPLTCLSPTPTHWLRTRCVCIVRSTCATWRGSISASIPTADPSCSRSTRSCTSAPACYPWARPTRASTSTHSATASAVAPSRGEPEIWAAGVVPGGTKAELEGQIAVQKATIANLKAQLQGQKNAQEATIERIKAELRNAKTECSRYQTLYRDGAVSAQERDNFCLQEKTVGTRLKEAQANLDRIITTRQEQIAEAQANLNRTISTVQRQIEESQGAFDAVAEVRSVDIEVAIAELNAAQADVRRAQAELDLAYVKSPMDSRILEIHTRLGEMVGDRGIVEIGQTDQMYVTAESFMDN